MSAGSAGLRIFRWMRDVLLFEDSSAASAHLHHSVKTRKGCWSEYFMAMLLIIKLPGAEAASSAATI